MESKTLFIRVVAAMQAADTRVLRDLTQAELKALMDYWIQEMTEEEFARKSELGGNT